MSAGKLRELSKNSAIYGVGDVAIQIVNFLLLRVYVLYLSKEDYGILALLGSVEAITKLFFRWGVDGSFMRFWFDAEDGAARQRLASTIFFFLLAVNGVLLVAAFAAAPYLTARLLGDRTYTLALQLVLLNTFGIGFTFIPFHMLRIEGRAREFSALAFGRSVSTLLVRLLLVVGLGYGVMGVVVADLVVTAVLMAIMVRWFAPLIRPLFSRAVLRETLAFGLPRVPHGLALQLMAVGDRFLLKFFGTPIELIGVYSIGVSFGLIPKIALGAFEYAWAPFYYATAKEPGAAKVFSTVTTYGVAALALLTAGLAAIARDLLAVVTHGQYVAAEPVVAWIAVGVAFYGVYLLTSIGLNITKQTQFYPVATGIGVAVNVALNAFLIPRYGIVGAAWANAATYALQAAIALALSQRYYPVRYEGGRLSRAVLAAGLAYLAAIVLPAMPSPLAGVIVRGVTVVGVMAAVLLATGFFRPDELRHLNALRTRVRFRRPETLPPDTTEMAGEVIAADVQDEGLRTRDTIRPSSDEPVSR